MSTTFPLGQDTLQHAIDRIGVVDMNTATIRQICAVAAEMERSSGTHFLHLEMGNPGLPPSLVGINAEIEAHRHGIANQYPNIIGIKPLKENGSRFVKAFLDLDIPPRCIVPTVGSMQASFTLFILLGQRKPGADTILYINPGFPAQRNQAKLLGLNTEQFDIYEYRGAKLEAKLESVLSSGKVSALIYSNPNNPAWFNLTDEELEIIGRMASKYDVFVVEDLAYFAMDFRKPLGRPYEPPFVSTVARYTDNYILLISASKMFSYAGQRIAMVCMSETVCDSTSDFIRSFYEMPTFGDAYVFGVLYCASSGVCHSAQYAYAAMLGAAVDGKLDFVSDCAEYGRRAARAKKIFADNGFHIVYSHDGDAPIADGFFFTVGYQGFNGEQLHAALLRHGIATIPLRSTGSCQEGLRVCISTLVNDSDFDNLAERLAIFHQSNPV